MSNTVERIISWANRTDMKTITVGMLKDWILEMELENQLEEQVVQAENHNLSDIMVLKVISSYLIDQIDPQPSISLEDLAGLNVEDLIDYKIPEELFTMQHYTPSEIKNMKDMLSRIIIKMENKQVDNI